MRAVVTRVNHAAVAIGGETVGRIGRGFLILLGVTHDDTEAQARKLADKICSLRIFEDEAGKMNIGLDQVGGCGGEKGGKVSEGEWRRGEWGRREER